MATSDDEDEAPPPPRNVNDEGKRKRMKLDDEEEDEVEEAAKKQKKAAEEDEETLAPSGGEDEEPVQEDAKPLGEVVRVSGKGRGRRSHYESFEYDGIRYDLVSDFFSPPNLFKVPKWGTFVCLI